MEEKSKEVWKDIPGYEGFYQISSFGRVLSLPKEIKRGKGYFKTKKRILRAGLSSNKYYTVALCNNGNQKTMFIHQLVAIAFLDSDYKLKGLVVDHINNIRHDNRLENLQLVTVRKNSTKDRKSKHSELRGVTFNINNNKWKSSIMVNGKDVYLGYFKTEQEASEYYENALKCIQDGRIDDIQVKRNSYTSKYKGVWRIEKLNKWASKVVKNGNRYYLGLFDKEEDAYEARVNKLKEIEDGREQ